MYSKPTNPIPVVEKKPADASWATIPNKDQLAILALSRLVDFWQMASLQSYMIHQLRSFDPMLPEATISHQAGILQGSFTAAQIVTSILWGRAADKPALGRKNVLLIGLIGTGISCIGVGFAETFWQATLWRMLGGAINGTVGAARTIVAECVEKKYHSRAFLLLPVAFNVANILGPVVGGLLVHPATTFSSKFGQNSIYGGATGVAWMMKYPYALPSLLSAFLLFSEAILVIMCLRETLPTARLRQGKNSYTLEMWNGITGILRSSKFQSYLPLESSPAPCHQDEEDKLESPVSAHYDKMHPPKSAQILHFKRIWTSNVLHTLLTIAIFDFHMGAFSSLWVIFLSTSRPSTTSSTLSKRTPFQFAGGLAFRPPTIGASLAILGLVGLAMQLLLYPAANARYGLMRCFRLSLFLFPAAYALAPYLSLLPSSTPPPGPAAGFWIWAGMCVVLTFQVAARTFALPASIILLNNSSPHPSVLATIHGVGQSVSTAGRTIGPIVAGYWNGMGLKKGSVGLAWWAVAGVSAIGCVGSFWVRNGSGHEIFLPGEREEMEKMEKKN
ncbi:MFS general substrate transporter [Mytilinidion resinicola]|uniref:MFS general substrate transporter n=1 Tax=Mytilinidion resinicola TaxID=574789 RepID=A0A6A6Z2E0_9PEZI|nr:MFS general substrate transporter [Mytilinidion resinicola]KAF2814889.1 MFS general substrate transporter [Mytilinidion resinicola]